MYMYGSSFHAYHKSGIKFGTSRGDHSLGPNRSVCNQLTTGTISSRILQHRVNEMKHMGAVLECCAASFGCHFMITHFNCAKHFKYSSVKPYFSSFKGFFFLAFSLYKLVEFIF